MNVAKRSEENQLGREQSRQYGGVPPWLGALAVGTAFCLLVWGETKRPLRRTAPEPKARRDVRNLVIAAIAGVTLQVAETPVTSRLTRLVEQNRYGLLKRLPLPLSAEILIAVLLMDYTFYLWHKLNHRVGLLWRFHQPHHVDLGLDTSTALRFHFSELTVSVGWRAAQILVIGVSPLALSVWQLFMLLEILFHHSNMELPIALERLLSKVIVTPRLHGIHHSIVKQEQESNLSSGFTIWDYLHRTLRLDVPQSEVTIGVPAYLNPKDIRLPEVLTMPFVDHRFSWELPNGQVPIRDASATPAHRLAP
jgi:sterol desaturase/sphingolipid hydroxylase (fatty acid hydroxylase superfamily)